MNRIIHYFIGVLLMVLIYSCSEKTNVDASAARVDLSLYTVEDVPGSDWQKVSRNHSTGELYEEGYVSNGVRQGTWTVYYPKEGYIQTISSYTNGIFTGPFIEFDERGKLLKQANYMNNQLHGLYGEFKSGRPVKKVQYKQGKINGFVKDYNSKMTLVKETYYKDNELDGKMRHFNEDGKVILEYDYKNGEKIGGGIVE